MAGLMSAQLRLAARVLALRRPSASAACPCCSCSCPATRSLAIGRIPLPWLVLAVVVYPVALVVARYYVRAGRAHRGRVLRRRRPTRAVTECVRLRLRRRRHRPHLHGHPGDRRVRPAALAHDERLLRRRPHRHAIPQRQRHRRRVPLCRKLSRHRRARLHQRPRHAVVPRRLHRRATSCCSSSSPHRCAGPAPTRCPDFAEARLESTVIRELVLGPRRGHRLALPAAAAPGRRAGPRHRHRCAHAGSAASSWPSSWWPTSPPVACARSRSCRRCSTGSS